LLSSFNIPIAIGHRRTTSITFSSPFWRRRPRLFWDRY